MENFLFWIVPSASLLALLLAWYFYKQMKAQSEGNDTMTIAESMILFFSRILLILIGCNNFV